jgi:hypothetical protein
LANCFEALLVCNGVGQSVFRHHTSKRCRRLLPLASYGFAFGLCRDDMADNDVLQWLAGMANE